MALLGRGADDLPMRKATIFASLERLVESQQGSGLQDNGELRKPACRDEQGSNTENKAIERIQIRRPPPPAAADDQLMLQQQGVRHEGPYSARAHEFGNGGQQMDGEYEQANHRPGR